MNEQITDRPTPLGLRALDSQALEAHRGLRKIIAIWEIGMKDPDRSIRVFTLVASIAGFLLLFILAFSALHVFAAKTLPTMKAPPLDVYFFAALTVFVVLVIPAIFAVPRFMNRASVGALDAGFKKVLQQKHSSGLA